MHSKYLYPSGLVPAALNVKHGYRNFWVRDGYYVGNCYGGEVKSKLWDGMIAVLDRYKWKLEIHAKIPPKHWYEHIHIRYTPEGEEIGFEPWCHNQFDAHANWGEVCLDKGRLDLAELLIDYLRTVKFHVAPAAGAWEDRYCTDAYSLAACINFFQRAKSYLPHRYRELDLSIKQALRTLNKLLPFATPSKIICLSLLGVIWPYNLAGIYKDEIISLVKKHLMREPFGFIRYRGDRYDGEGFTRGEGTELPWILGDCYMQYIEPENPIWRQRLDHAYSVFNCMPEAFFPETMVANRNSPLLWAQSMYENPA